MSEGVMTARPYVLGYSPEETARLEQQAELRNSSTRSLLAEAGIGEGMKVLDVGSGAGDVALIAADLVGSSGSVVGVDADPVVLERARERATAAGQTHVSFVSGDFHAVALDDDFDAVVGRLILVHQADPAATLRSLAGHVSSGGVVAFQEIAMMRPPFDVPHSPLHQQMLDWTARVMDHTGSDASLGLKLGRVFLDAGLPEPRMHLTAPVGGGPDWPGYDFIGRAFATFLKLALTHGLTTADEVAAIDVETYAARFRDEVVRQGGVITLTPYVGAWVCKP